MTVRDILKVVSISDYIKINGVFYDCVLDCYDHISADIMKKEVVLICIEDEDIISISTKGEWYEDQNGSREDQRERNH